MAPADRIATFDYDGTMRCEKPLNLQADFFLKRMWEVVSADPALAQDQQTLGLLSCSIMMMISAGNLGLIHGARLHQTRKRRLSSVACLVAPWYHGRDRTSAPNAGALDERGFLQ